ALNSLLAWWWADPVAALFLVPFFLKEGRENLAGHEDEDEDRGRTVCFCLPCFYGVLDCRYPHVVLRWCRTECCPA
ncbi:MAG: hypothetical protein OXK21_09195, partial [Chloroflexota bacterium]|nr:hypothetical protein [Chloroflexota bacterium]